MVKKFKNLTIEEKEEICNGCGGKGGIVKPPHGKFLIDECNHHDYNYFLGHTEHDRLKADKQLRTAIRKKIKETPIAELQKELLIPDNKKVPEVLIRQIYFRWADAYWVGVTIMGWKFFYYGDSEQEFK